ncbi:hypothetical protein NE865_10084 [Phthorimaea operculella]|nr:hypothetical protein NE865_10084 [Phthorimaea operculella]
MSAFRALKDASKNFEEELRRVSNELFSAKIEESFEENISKKLRDLSLYTAKLRLLLAKPLSQTPQVSDHERDEDTTLEAYGDTVAARIIEQQLVKSATQAHAVKTLVTAPDRTLDPEMVERKEKIKAALAAYKKQEMSVQHLDSVLQEKEAALLELQERWDEELTMMKEEQGEVDEPATDVDNPLYQKLSSVVSKLEMMRWLMGRLGVPRSHGYDWLSDPQQRLRAIKLAREHYSVETFVQNS